jgi:hypothetical protein
MKTILQFRNRSLDCFFCYKHLLLITLFAIINSLTVYSQDVGIAPVDPPSGGFDIEGDLLSNTPTANVGDWFDNAGGTGGYVFDSVESYRCHWIQL